MATLLVMVAAGCRSGAGAPGAVARSAPPTSIVHGSASSGSPPGAPTPPPGPVTSPATADTPPPGAPPDTSPPGRGVIVTPGGIVVPVVAEVAGGWRVRAPCGGTVVIHGGTRVRRATVVLDAGHGGHERGALAPGGLAEATVNLNVVRRAAAELEAAGVPTVLTRTGDYDLSLGTRADIATGLGPRAFVSVHHNAVPDGPSPRPGTETYYQIGSATSKRLAGLVYEEVARALDRYRVAWVADRDAGAKYRPGARGDYYAILRLPAKVTSVLAELAFVTNPAEADLLARDDVQAVEGQAVARGILRYLRTTDPGSGFTEPYPRVDEPATGPPPPCIDPPL